MFKRHEQPIHKKGMELAPNHIKKIFNLTKVRKIKLKLLEKSNWPGSGTDFQILVITVFCVFENYTCMHFTVMMKGGLPVKCFRILWGQFPRSGAWACDLWRAGSKEKPAGEWGKQGGAGLGVAVDSGQRYHSGGLRAQPGPAGHGAVSGSRAAVHPEARGWAANRA